MYLRKYYIIMEVSFMHGEIDRIGLKMLRLLQGNGRLTNAELAQLVDISPATCHRRTQSLFEAGYIGRVRAMIAPQKVDRGALVMEIGRASCRERVYGRV